MGCDEKECVTTNTEDFDNGNIINEVNCENEDQKQDVGSLRKSNYSIPRIASFEKISFEEFCKTYKPIWVQNQKIIAIQNGQDVTDGFGYSEQEFEETASSIYDNIKLPTRATSGSAGYDFVFPFGRTELVPQASITIPTGIKCYIDTGWVLQLVPRSSLGRDFRLQLDNTVGIIDSDYYNCKNNEGHILVKLTNDSREGKTCIFEPGTKFCQGLFIPFGITVDDNVSTERVGGYGSTGYKKS